MRKIVEIPLERLNGLLPYFSASTAVPVEGPALARPAGVGVWRCEVNMEGGPFFATYAGPSPSECWSYLVWRNVELFERTHREAVGQFTEKEHERKGFGTVVLEAALQDPLPLLSDREGMTFGAAQLWYRRALKGGAHLLDIDSGALTELAGLPWNELWHDGPDCARQQIVFGEHV